MTDIISAILILTGSALTAAAGIGIVRLPDVFTRMHAATKVGTLGSGLILAGAAVHFGHGAIVLRCILIVFFFVAHSAHRGPYDRQGCPAHKKRKRV